MRVVGIFNLMLGTFWVQFIILNEQNPSSGSRFYALRLVGDSVFLEYETFSITNNNNSI